MKLAGDFIPIGELARRTGSSVSAIRFYEDKGLLDSLRSSGGQRRFLRSDIRRLSFIRIVQQCGFTIQDIREMLDGLPHGRTPTKADWTKLSRVMRAELDRRITLMEGLRDRLDGCIGCGCLSLRACRLYNPDDQRGGDGPGPHRLVRP